MPDHTRESTLERLSKINPVWTKILAKYEWNRQLPKHLKGMRDKTGELAEPGTVDLYDITSGCCCIVGEAHGKPSGEYGCGICSTYAVLFMKGTVRFTEEIMLTTLITESDWIESLNFFMNHFECEHQVITN